MKDSNVYLKTGKWTSDIVYKILTNSIYIGIFEYGKYCRKPQEKKLVDLYLSSTLNVETINNKNNTDNSIRNCIKWVELFKENELKNSTRKNANF